MKRIFLLSGIFASFFVAGCYKEYKNPGAATGAEILTDANGLTAIAVGIQSSYSGVALYAQVTISGFATKELRLLNPGNTAENDLLAGGASVANTNSRVAGLWVAMNKVSYNAETILANAGIAPSGVQEGLKAYAYLYKALAIGTMATFWTDVPVNTGTNATFSSRNAALSAAIDLLKKGELLVPAISAAFYSKVPTGIDLKNAIPALEARYYNMLKDDANALVAANKVDLSSKSWFAFSTTNTNQINVIAIGGINVYQPNDDITFGLPNALIPNPADGRIPFYTYRNAGSASDVRGKGFFQTNASPIPVYLPGEMTLIKAESYIRKAGADITQLPLAVTELNKVLTKTTDVWGVNANLPAYAGALNVTAVSNEIYRNRRMELFMSGLELEDCRRFGRPGPEINGTERNKTYYLFPLAERANNPNTPADPPF